MARPSNKIPQWKLIFRLLSNMIKSIRPSYYQVLNLPQNNAKKTRTGHTYFEQYCGFHPIVSYIEDINPAPGQKSRTCEILRYKPLCLCVKKSFSMLKSFKNFIMINIQSLKVISQEAKFYGIVNISRPSQTANLSKFFLNFFQY